MISKGKTLIFGRRRRRKNRVFETPKSRFLRVKRPKKFPIFAQIWDLGVENPPLLRVDFSTRGGFRLGSGLIKDRAHLLRADFVFSRKKICQILKSKISLSSMRVRQVRGNPRYQDAGLSLRTASFSSTLVLKTVCS